MADREQVVNLLSDKLSRRRLGIIQSTITTTGNTWLVKEPHSLGTSAIPGTIEYTLGNKIYVSDSTGLDEIALVGLVMGRVNALFRRTKIGAEALKIIADSELTPDQIEAAKAIFNHNLVVVQGAAGTGKTYLISILTAILRKMGKVPTLLAPTGRAALNLVDKIGIPALTIHKYLRFDGENFNAYPGSMMPTPFIFVDEGFMVDNKCWIKLFQVTDPGTPIIIFGDRNQLYPVSPGAFMEDLMKANVCPVAILRTNKRFSSAGSMLSVSNAILEGHIPQESDNDAGFHTHDTYTPSELTLAGRKQKERQNRIVRLVGRPVTYQHVPEIVNDFLWEFSDIDPDFRIISPIYEGELGVNKINLAMKAYFNADNTEAIPIINTANNYDTNIMNGDRGIWHPNSSYAIFPRGKEVYNPEKHHLAYATSIHKAQGSESNAVFLAFPEHTQSDFRALYTGVTRAAVRLDYMGRKTQLVKAVEEGPNQRFTLLGRLLGTPTGEIHDHFRDHREEQGESAADEHHPRAAGAGGVRRLHRRQRRG